jgi:N-acetylglucosamine-6-phosphate deacetylase
MINEKDIIIYNATIVSGEDCTFHSNSALVIEEGYIKNIIYEKVEWEALIKKSRIRTYDADSNILGPGFIDMHIHGCGGFDTTQSNKTNILSNMATILANRGITYFQPTIHCDFNEIKNLAETIENDLVLQNYMNGIYVEGPFINRDKKGGLPISSIHKTDFDYLKKLLSIKIGNKPAITTMTVAPELDNISSVIELLNTSGVIVSFGHSNAHIEDVPTQEKYHFTHLFNAMSSIDHKRPGLASFPFVHNNDNNICCELTCDGVHVNDDILRMSFNCLNHNQICLISDAMKFATMPVNQKGIYANREAYSNEKACYYSDDNTLIGAVSLIIDTARFLLEKGIIPKETFFKIGAFNPAKELNLKELGSIAIHKRADLILLNKEYRVIEVFKQIITKN